MSPSAPIAELLTQHKPGHSLAQAFYTRPDIYEADLQTIFYASGSLLCRPVRCPRWAAMSG